MIVLSRCLLLLVCGFLFVENNDAQVSTAMHGKGCFMKTSEDGSSNRRICASSMKTIAYDTPHDKKHHGKEKVAKRITDVIDIETLESTLVVSYAAVGDKCKIQYNGQECSACYLCADNEIAYDCANLPNGRCTVNKCERILQLEEPNKNHPNGRVQRFVLPVDLGTTPLPPTKCDDLHFSVLEDTWINPKHPNTSMEDKKRLRMSNKKQYALIKFEVTNLMDGVSNGVKDAFLKLRAVDDIPSMSVRLPEGGYSSTGIAKDDWEEELKTYHMLSDKSLMDQMANIETMTAPIDQKKDLIKDHWYSFDVSKVVTKNGMYTFIIKTDTPGIIVGVYGMGTDYEPELIVRPHLPYAPHGHKQEHHQPQPSLHTDHAHGIIAFGNKLTLSEPVKPSEIEHVFVEAALATMYGHVFDEVEMRRLDHVDDIMENVHVIAIAHSTSKETQYNVEVIITVPLEAWEHITGLMQDDSEYDKFLSNLNNQYSNMNGKILDVQSHVQDVQLPKGMHGEKPHVPEYAVLCEGQHPDHFCDCSWDCQNKPAWCSCSEAEKCCEENDYDNVPEYAVLCEGQDNYAYCDCSSDCQNMTAWCACSEAEKCCAENDYSYDSSDEHKGHSIYPTGDGGHSDYAHSDGSHYHMTHPPAVSQDSVPVGTVRCPGHQNDNFCDCHDDCTDAPIWCSCSAARACCAENGFEYTPIHQINTELGGGDSLLPTEPPTTNPPVSAEVTTAPTMVMN